MAQHPQLENRFASFVHATRGVPILCLSEQKVQNVASIFYLFTRASVSFISWACISYLSASPCEFSKKVRKERFLEEFSKKVHKESS